MSDTPAAALPLPQNAPAAGHSDHGLGRWFALGFTMLAWLAALALAGLALLRFVYFDGTKLLTCINAFTLYAYLPAYVCLAWAVWRRQRALALLSGLVVAVHLGLVLPHYLPIPSSHNNPTATARASRTVRIFSANVLADNHDFGLLLDEIRETDPDVVVIIEHTVWCRRAIYDSEELKPYIYGREFTRPFYIPMVVYSKLPILDYQRNWTHQRLTCSIELEVDDQVLHLFCLHGPRPMDMPMHDYYGYWKEVMPQLAAEPDPLVVVGDFNATQFSKVFDELTSDRLRSAHEDRGRGYATTWPNGKFWIPPIRIDQALLSPGVECVDIREGDGGSSDHRPLILDVRLAPNE